MNMTGNLHHALTGSLLSPADKRPRHLFVCAIMFSRFPHDIQREVFELLADIRYLPVLLISNDVHGWTAPIIYASIRLALVEIRGFAKNTLRSTSRFRDRQISSIRHIDIDSRGDDAAETREIVEGCPRLRSLSFLSWGWPLRREIPPGLLRLAAQFPFPSSLLPRSESLTHLELYNHGSNWPKVPPFASSFPSLTHLLMGQYTDEDTPSPEPLREVVERIMRYLTPSIHALVLRVKQSTEGYEPEVVERVVRGDADMRLLLDVQDPRPELKDGAEGWFISLPSSHHRDPERDPHLLWKEADRIIERRRQEPQALQRLVVWPVGSSA